MLPLVGVAEAIGEFIVPLLFLLVVVGGNIIAWLSKRANRGRDLEQLREARERIRRGRAERGEHAERGQAEAEPSHDDRRRRALAERRRAASDRPTPPPLPSRDVAAELEARRAAQAQRKAAEQRVAQEEAARRQQLDRRRQAEELRRRQELQRRQQAARRPPAQRPQQQPARPAIATAGVTPNVFDSAIGAGEIGDAPSRGPRNTRRTALRNLLRGGNLKTVIAAREVLGPPAALRDGPP